MADTSSVTGGETQSPVSEELLMDQDFPKEQAVVPDSSGAEVINQGHEATDSKDSPVAVSSEASAQECEDSTVLEEASPSSQGAESPKGATDDSRSTPLSEGYSEEQQGGASKSEERSQSADSASYSVPSLELSEGNNSNSLDEALSSSYSALGAEGQSPTADVDMPCLEEEALGAAAAATAIAGGSSAAAAAAPNSDPVLPAYYFVKWITWKEKKTPIITQSENGPCPLLAIMNILFLRWKAKLPPQTEVITTEDLMAHLGECVLSIKPRDKVQGMELNFQQNMSDAMAVLPKLSTGLDVNVRFTGVSDFEYTPECIVFDLLDIPLYHGWLVDPQSVEMVTAVGKLSYNQLVEKIIDYKHSADSSRLNTTAKEGELSVFFRNNHFSTMIKHKDHLYLLVTDQGFLQEESVVWESLHNVEGDGNFCDSEFRLGQASSSQQGGQRRRGDKKDDSDCAIL
ncbi:hypothetical protein JZ751_007239 [Albula glossodonta]|uniref:Ubiquitin carboxyl-terminal hydrolase n=1 Tax=Albula glossodonta TaxID=121402 RepID=A0A8T2N3S1_9TELE|nr:hypothetical protein JZ751_007239 [Albula glossodonta]